MACKKIVNSLGNSMFQLQLTVMLLPENCKV